MKKLIQEIGLSVLISVTVGNTGSEVLSEITHLLSSTAYGRTIEKEADLKAGKISASSPIGKGLLGKKVGEIAEVVAPNGTMKFMIDNITI